MDVYVKVYKIENGNIAGGKLIDEVPLLDVSEFGSVKKYLEEDATEFRMDSISLKTEFLPKGYFDDYEPQKPYLVEVQVGSGWDASDSRCVFYGPIKKKSIKYNDRTGVTSFEGSSWDRAIKQAQRMVARTRTPVKVARAYRRDGQGGGSDKMHVVGTDPDIDTEIQPGTVLKTKGEVGEESIDFHFIATETPAQDGTVDGEQVYEFDVISGSDDLLSQGPVGGIDLLWELETDHRQTQQGNRVARWWPRDNIFGAPVDQVNSDPDGVKGATFTFKLNGKTVERKVTNAFIGPKLHGPEVKIGDLDTSNVNRGQYFWFVLDESLFLSGYNALDNERVEYPYFVGGLPAFDFTTDPLPGTFEGAQWTISKRMRVKQGEDGTLISDDAYGVGAQTVENYDPIDLAQGIATRTPALADLLEASATVQGSPGEISRMYEFPEKGVESLGQIQRSSQTIMSFEPRSRDGSGGERKNNGARKVRLVARTREYMAGQSAIALPDTFEWKGEALGDKPDVVLVKGPKPINITSERDEAYGWHPKDAIENPDQASSQGKEYTEIQIPLAPAVIQAKDAFALPENVPSLSGRAKRYYDFYSQYYREKKAVVDGVFDNVTNADIEESVLGRVVSENDSVFESGIVKSQSVDYEREETTLTLLVAESYTAPPNQAPTAVVNAPTLLRGSGSVGVTVDGYGSHDPEGDKLTYEWSKNGIVISGETDEYLNTSVSDGDTISLTVTDPDGATSSDSVDFIVLPESEFPDDPNDPPYFTLSFDGGASDADTSVFDIQAWKNGADLAIRYQIENGQSIVESGTLATGSDNLSSSLSVERIENNQGRSLHVTVWVQDETNGVTSDEKSRVVREDYLPEVLSATVNPINRGGGSVLIHVDLDDDSDYYDLEWYVEDSGGNEVGSDLLTSVSEGTKQFYIDEVPDGGSGWIKAKPKGSPGLSKKLIAGPVRTILIGPPEDPSTRFTILGQKTTSTTLSDPNSTLNITETTGGDGIQYEVSVPQKVGPNDSPDFAGVTLGSHAVGGIQTVLRDSINATDDRLVTEKGARDAIDAATGGGALDDLTDVGASLPADDEVLTYSTEEGQWRNESPATLTGGDGIEPIGSLGSDQTVAVDSTVARTDANETFDQNVTIQGDLTVNGTQFVTNTETVEIQDNLAVINNGESGSGVTEGFAGWQVDRGSLTDYYFGFDEGRDRFVVGQGTVDRDVVATREDSPSTDGIPFWNGTENRFDTSSALQWDGSDVLIGTGKATVTDENEVIEGAWDFNADIESGDFVSRTTGWQIAKDGAADFRSIWADTLRVQAFTADVAQALVGTEIITKSRATVAEDFTIPATGNTSTLRVEDIDGQGGTRAFTDGDTVRLRVVDRSGGGFVVADVWGTVSVPSDGITDNGDGTQSWDFLVADDGGVAGKTIYEGATALDWGTPGDGQIYSTVLDGAGSPYTDHRTWSDSGSDGVPDSYDTLVRIGVLDGISGVSGDGLWTKRGRFTEDVLIGDLSKTNGYIEANQGTLTVQGKIIVKGGSDIGWGYVSGSNKPEDSATVGATWGSNIADPNNNLPEDNATFGSTWGNVTGASKPEDGATVGATWGSNISDPNGNLPEDNATFGAAWANVTGTNRPADNADVTANNQAASISGQGSLATQDDADWGTDVTGPNKPADNADVTANNQAASISGQGSLATQDNADWVNDIANRPNAADLLQDFEPSVDNQLAITPGGLGYYTVDVNGDFNGWISALLDDGTGFLANGLIAWDKSTGDFGNANADLTVEGEIFVQQGSVRDNFIVGDSIFMWDSNSAGAPSTEDEIRVSKNGTGDGSSNYSRIYQDPAAGGAWGIEQVSGSSRIFHVGEDSNGNLDNVIAGWTFDTNTLYGPGSDDLISDGGGVTLAANVARSTGNQGDRQSYVCVHNSDETTFASMYYAHDNSFGFVVKKSGQGKIAHFGDEMMLNYLTIKGDAVVKGNAVVQDELFANDATVSGTLTMGDGNGNGAITNSNIDYKITNTGFWVAQGKNLDSASYNIGTHRIYDPNGQLLTMQADAANIEIGIVNATVARGIKLDASSNTGDITAEIDGSNGGQFAVTGPVHVDHQFQQTDPAAPPNGCLLYLYETSGGGHSLKVKFANGIEKVIANDV